MDSRMQLYSTGLFKALMSQFYTFSPAWFCSEHLVNSNFWERLLAELGRVKSTTEDEARPGLAGWRDGEDVIEWLDRYNYGASFSFSPITGCNNKKGRRNFPNFSKKKFHIEIIYLKFVEYFFFFFKTPPNVIFGIKKILTRSILIRKIWFFFSMHKITKLKKWL